MRKISTIGAPIISFCAACLFAANTDEGYEDLGLKSNYQRAHQLEKVSASILSGMGASMCKGKDIHSLPKLVNGKMFVVGYPQADGSEELFYIYNNEGAKKILHCIQEPEPKPNYYFLPPWLS